MQRCNRHGLGLILTGLLVACSSAPKSLPAAQVPPLGHPPLTEVVITRVFEAPRSQVFRTWTQPAYAKRWFGPKDFTTPVYKADLREGGKYLYGMKSPDGKMFYGGGAYREFVDQKKIDASDSFMDAEGNIVEPSVYGMPAEFPKVAYVNVTFEDEGKNKTKMTLRHSGLPAGKMAEITEEGWKQSLDKFATTLKTHKALPKK